MGTFKPNLETKQSIDNLTQTLLDQLPAQLGIDEIIPGCEVISADTYGVGVGVLPRYITVALGGNEYVPVLFRGGITVTVGAFVTVLHYRNGDLYEVLGAGGAAGYIVAIAHNLLSATHTDTVAAAVLRGYLTRGNATPAWERFDALTAGFVVQGNGTDVVSIAFDWDNFAAGAGADMVHNHSAAGEGDEIPLASLGGYTRGDLIYGGAADWQDLAHPGFANHVLQSTAAEVGWSANAVTFPTAGAVPVGSGANTQVAYWTAANTLAGDAGMTYIVGSQSVDIAGHLAVGGSAAISATSVLNIQEITTLVAGGFSGGGLTILFNPDANFATTVQGFAGSVVLGTAYTWTAGSLIGVVGSAYISNAIDARNTTLRGGQFSVGVDDAGSGGGWGAYYAEGCRVSTPSVDTGTCLNGYGLHITQGSNNNVISLLYGLYIDAITVGNTSYAIYSAGGQSYHAGTLSVGGTVAAAAQLHVDNAGTVARPVLTLDQGDVSEQMIDFITTIGVGNAIEAKGAKTLTPTHFIKISIPGALTRYIQCGTIA